MKPNWYRIAGLLLMILSAFIVIMIGAMIIF